MAGAGLPDRKELSTRLSASDALAGVSMALVLIPQALAYAHIAGVPAQYGLFAAALPPIAAAFFASSPWLQTGPAAVTALLTAGALAGMAQPFTREYVLLAALLALMVGLIRIGIGMLRAGRVVYLMSEPVLRGFTTGAAILIIMAQVPAVLGLESAANGVVAELFDVLRRVASWNVEAIGLAAVSLLIVFGARRMHPYIPGVLIATVAAVLYSNLTGYDGAVLGDVPRGWPVPNLDLPYAAGPALLLSSAVIALIGFSEAASIARHYASRERLRWNPDREFVSQGVANVASAIGGGFPVGGSFSRSGLAYMLGARTRWSGAITGITVFAFLPFANVLAPLPTAVLAALVIAAVVGMVRIRPILGVWRFSRAQFAVAAGTLLLTLLLSPRIDQAVVLGVLLAIGVHLWREFGLRVARWQDGDTLNIRPEGVLWFGSADAFKAEVADLLADHRDAGRLVVHMERLGRVDLTGSLVLEQVLQDARDAGLETEIVNVHPETARVLRKVLAHEARVRRATSRSPADA